MIPNYLSAFWVSLAPAVGNHLWQSTLCIVMAGLMTWVLRKNPARARYGIWLAASVKFLIPFSLLVNLGSNLAKPRSASVLPAGLSVAMREVSQPFTQPTPVISPVVHSATSPNLVPLLPAFLAAMWLVGLVVILSVWYVRWRRISAALRAASPLRQGREVEALRRLERLAGVRKRIEMRLSGTSLEPGIFGIVKPVLVWPKGISERLDDAHLEAVLAHEVWHVRRRDNLAAAIHMVVEALFWFHPLVWWLGARLVEEREHACDEEVLRLGNRPQVYAESILKTCEFYVESPLPCVSGVTGADLKERIVRIMTQRLANKLSVGRKLLLAAIGIAAVAGPVVLGLVNAPPIRAQSPQSTAGPLPSFEVASIKPNKPDRFGEVRFSIMFEPGRFISTGVTIEQLIALAYHIKDFQVTGGPGWINSDRYDVEAKEPDSLVAELPKLPPEQRREKLGLLLQSLLADRFKLKVNHETKDLPVYALVVAKNGPKLQEAKPGDTYPNGIKGPDGRPAGGAQMMRMEPGELTGQGLPMASLVHLLSQQLGRDVLDQTGLKGNYDFTLKWTPDQNPTTMPMGPDAGKPSADTAPPPESSGPSIFTAIQEQLGLKLESTKGPVDILVIDHVERPSEN